MGKCWKSLLVQMAGFKVSYQRRLPLSSICCSKCSGELNPNLQIHKYGKNNSFQALNNKEPLQFLKGDFSLFKPCGKGIPYSLALLLLSKTSEIFMLEEFWPESPSQQSISKVLELITDPKSLKTLPEFFGILSIFLQGI